MASNTIEKVLRLRDEITPALKKVSKQADQTTDSLDDLGDEAKKAGDEGEGMGSRFGGPAAQGLKMAGAAALAAGAAFAALGVSAVQVGSQMEGFETRLGVLMGTSDAAKTRLAELFEIGTTTPFELGSLVEAEINLRALGVEAESALPLIMDFAGAMGVDLSTAAVEVGRAMQFGAGAVETIAGRALRAQVELRTGQNALKMSTEEFKAALIETLSATDGIFAGGTEKLAATFSGMMSNLSDAWFKFRKEVADAGLFLHAKAALGVILERLDTGAAKTQDWARLASGALTDSFFGVAQMAAWTGQGVLALILGADTLANAIRAIAGIWLTVNTHAADLLVWVVRIHQQMLEMMDSMLRTNLADALAGPLAAAESAAQSLRIAMIENEGAIHGTRSEMFLLLERINDLSGAGEVFDDIRARAGELEKALQMEASIKVNQEDLNDLREALGLGRVETGALTIAAGAVTSTSPRSGGQSTADRLAGQVEALTKRAFPITQIEAAGRLLTELETARDKARRSRKAGFDELIAQATQAQTALEAVELGKITDGMTKELEGLVSSLEGVGPALDEFAASGAQMVADLRASQVQAVTGGIQAGAGAMTNLSGALGALGPVGGAVGAVAGLGEAAAGEEGGLEALVTQNVEGFVNGMVALLEQLPDVISRVIPILLAEGIPKLIVALAKAAPALAKAILIDLPLTLTQAFGDAFAAAWDAAWDAVQKFFRDLFSMDGLGGSIKDGFMEVITLGMWDSKQTGGFVNRTGLTMLHAGEVVQPTSGTMPQSARGRMGGGGGGGVNITINTNVVDPNAIDQLGRMLQRHFGAMGRTTLPIFGGG